MRAIALALLATSLARADVEYRVDLAERDRQRALVEMRVRSAKSPLELWMPVWTPGAYEVRTWGRNLTPVDASDANGKPLELKRTGPSTFRVTGHVPGLEVRVRYRVYAPLLSDDGSQLDARHALLNGSSMFLAARGAEGTIHRVHLAPPAGWRVHTALDETPGGDREAIGYEALIDAPIEIGRGAEAETHAAGRSYRVVVDGASEVPSRLLHDLAAIAEAESRLVGPPPYRRYLLLVHLSDGIGRLAALEHAASTSIVVPRKSLSPGDAYDELLYVIAHELFHAWNAKRLRPAELTPYNLERPTPARSLWITEGLTEYYAHRAMRLSGRWSRAKYLERLGEEMTRAVTASRRGLTLEEEAELAWQAPDEAAADPDAYYARGHLVALALDARIRGATDGKKTLDDVIRRLLEAADKNGGVLPLDGDGLAQEIARQAGTDAAAEVALLTQKPDEVARARPELAALGLSLAIEETPPRVAAGFAAESDAGGLRVAMVVPDGPAAHAGLRAGDRILTLDGAAPKKSWAADLAMRPAGANVAIEAVRATRHMLLELQLAELKGVVCKMTEAPAPPKIALRREAWMSR